MINYLDSYGSMYWFNYETKQNYCNSTMMNHLKNSGRVLEVKDDGLILGNSHNDGGIQCFMRTDNETCFCHFGEIEGWEFVLSINEHQKILSKINSTCWMEKNLRTYLNIDMFKEYDIPNNINTIRINGKEQILLFNTDLYYIINKFSTKKYLHQLNEMNKGIFNGGVPQRSSKP